MQVLERRQATHRITEWIRLEAHPVPTPCHRTRAAAQGGVEGKGKESPPFPPYLFSVKASAYPSQLTLSRICSQLHMGMFPRQVWSKVPGHTHQTTPKKASKSCLRILESFIAPSLRLTFNPCCHLRKFILQMMPHECHLCKNKINGTLSPAACPTQQNSPGNPGKHQGPAPCRESRLRTSALSLLPGNLSSLGTPAQNRNGFIYLSDSLLLRLLDGLWVLVVSGQAWVRAICRDPAAKPVSSLYNLTWDHIFHVKVQC